MGTSKQDAHSFTSDLRALVKPLGYTVYGSWARSYSQGHYHVGPTGDVSEGAAVVRFRMGTGIPRKHSGRGWQSRWAEDILAVVMKSIAADQVVSRLEAAYETYLIGDGGYNMLAAAAVAAELERCGRARLNVDAHNDTTRRWRAARRRCAERASERWTDSGSGAVKKPPQTALLSWDH